MSAVHTADVAEDPARRAPLRRGLSESRVANVAASAIHEAFDGYQARFRRVTRRARSRFEKREWQALRQDAGERLDLYRQVVEATVGQVQHLLGSRVEDRFIWAGMKAVYSGSIEERDDWELAETFFNSITRRIFTTVGVDSAIEFVDSDFDIPPTPPRERAYLAYDGPLSPLRLMRTLLRDCRHDVPYADEGAAAEQSAARLGEQLASLGLGTSIDRVEVLKPVFYRNKGAYLVGRLWSGDRLMPLGIALLNPPGGVVVDAVLLEEDALSRVFSFAHSYFHVDAERPHELVSFLKSIMPRKRVAELYISVGYHKHGKTELYRDLLRSLETSDEQFEIAPGERGMVMEVFTRPTHDLVLKVIKDHFAEPKHTTRRAVMEKYHLVFRHDRAGRLVDAQEFEHLEFNRARFSAALLERLLEAASATVSVEGERVHIKHAYVERRVRPLDLYLREVDDQVARAAALDYGTAIKDLAASNIFPGDFWLKNFGVTRHGRVVFYDYDELSLLTECRIATMPAPKTDAEELADEPWFYVGENDVFPEEFQKFLRLPRGLDAPFIEHHGDLFEVEFWRRMQERLQAGDIVDIFPYAQEKRLAAENE